MRRGLRVIQYGVPAAAMVFGGVTRFKRYWKTRNDDDNAAMGIRTRVKEILGISPSGEFVEMYHTDDFLDSDIAKWIMSMPVAEHFNIIGCWDASDWTQVPVGVTPKMSHNAQYLVGVRVGSIVVGLIMKITESLDRGS